MKAVRNAACSAAADLAAIPAAALQAAFRRCRSARATVVLTAEAGVPVALTARGLAAEGWDGLADTKAR